MTKMAVIQSSPGGICFILAYIKNFLAHRA